MTSRYAARALEVAEVFFDTDSLDRQHLTDATVDVIREFVQDATEGCAKALDEQRRDWEGRERVDPHELTSQLLRLALSFRERGRAE